MKKNSVGYFIKDLSRAVQLIVRASPYTAMLNFFLLFFQSALPVASLYLTKEIVELITENNAGLFHNLLFAIAAFCAVQLLSSIVVQLSGYVNTLQQQKLTDHLSTVVLDKAVSVDYEYYEDPSYYDTLHMAQQQSLYRVSNLLSNFNSLLLNALSLFFVGSLLLAINWLYALLFLGLALPVSLIKWYYGYRSFQLEKKLVPLERESNHLYQTLTGINYAKEVRQYGYGNAFIKKFRTLRSHIFGEKKRLQGRLALYSIIADTAEMIVVSFIFFTLAKNAFDKTITIGIFIVYLQGFQRIQGAAKSFLLSVVQIFQQRLFLRDLFSFLSLQRIVSSGNETKPFPAQADNFSISNVSFTYPGTEKQVLHDVSLTCSKGKIIAIVGENGCGKSTLVKIISRLYSLQQGNITVNDTALADITKEGFQQHTVFMFQDFEKYFFTVEENIALGDEQPDEIKIKDAATLSGAGTFIDKLSNGYQTRLGRTFARSEQLSGGQWQKLALARIFYKNPSLIVLDEPTSSIDALAENELFHNLKHWAKDKMVILISHRLYNVQIADHIYVMENGKIVEEGNFSSLTTRDGLFNRMYQTQKLG